MHDKAEEKRLEERRWQWWSATLRNQLRWILRHAQQAQEIRHGNDWNASGFFQFEHDNHRRALRASRMACSTAAWARKIIEKVIDKVILATGASMDGLHRQPRLARQDATRSWSFGFCASSDSQHKEWD